VFWRAVLELDPRAHDESGLAVFEKATSPNYSPRPDCGRLIRQC
jgi:hypothetical protein